MPGASTIARGNILLAGIYGVTLSPASVAANTTAEQTFTNLTGLQYGDLVSVTKPTLQAGLGIVNARVTTTGALAIAFSNNTGSPIVPTAGEVYTVELNRPENATLPTAVT